MQIFIAEEKNGRLLSERCFESQTIVIGRDPSTCQIIFDSGEWPMVSRRHVEFRLSNGRCTVVDKGSRFGTLVDGKQSTSPVAARPGTKVQLGREGPVL